MGRYVSGGGGGDLKSNQSGYIDASASSGTGLDASYVDVMISAVVTANADPTFEGGCGNSLVNAFTYSNTSARKTYCRMLNSTTLRISCPIDNVSRFTGYWRVKEAN